jgi:pimeloyl-ACP methyl ester carboxylesterase
MPGVAQMCDDCRAREEAAAPPISSTPVTETPEWKAAKGGRSDRIVLAVAGVAVLGVILVAAFVVLGGGDSDSPAVVDTATPTKDPDATLAPLGYATADCPFDPPPDTAPECGYLTVPLTRAEPDRGRVRIPVAVFRSDSSSKRSDALVYLDGGPGGNTLEEIALLYSVIEPLAEDRDLIIFDQRGAGFSEPSLDCPEVNEVNYELLLRQFTVDQRVAEDAKSAKECRDRLLSEGIDPAFATTAENAADVNELRIALGYEQWNLFGVSYGTKLALQVMRDFPTGVRSVILDSTYPQRVDLYAEHQAGFDRALGELFAACAADSGCSAVYPDLEAAFYETYDRLNEVPVQVSLGALEGRSRGAATIDGIWFANFVFQSMYSAELIPLMPRMIFDTRDHEYTLLQLFADSFLQTIEGISYGMYLSVQCGEEAPFSDRAAVIAAGAAHPRMPLYGEYAGKSVYAACDAWEAPAAAPAANEAVSSAIPTLVLAGQFDPVTPPGWGTLAAETLENSHFFEFPAIGHGAAFSDGCAADMALAFLENPAQAPNSGCVGSSGGVEWR